MQDTVVVRNAGKVLPDDFINLLLKDVKSTGTAIIKGGKLILDRIAYSTEEPPPTLDDFKAIQEEFKDCLAIHFFSTKERNTTSLQPYEVLVGTDTKPSLVLFLDGEFNNFKQADSTNLEDFFAADKMIIPYLKKLAKGNEGKLELLLNELNDDVNKMMLTNSIVSKGSITLVCPSWPEPITMDKNSGGSTFPWGWVSNTHGYTEQPPQQAPAESGGLLRRGRRALSSTVAPAPQPAPEPIKETPTEGPVEAKPGPKSDLEAAIAENKEREAEHEFISPPPELHGKRRKNWFQQNCTYVPSNYFEADSSAPAKKTIKSLSDLPKPKAEITVTSTHIPDETVGPKVPAEAVPEVKDPAKLKSELITLDRNNKAMDIDIKQVQALEAKHGNFLDMIGQNETYLHGKPYEWYVGLGKLGHDWLALLAWNLMNVIREKDHDIELLTTPKTLDTSGTGVVKQETQPHTGLLRRRLRA